MPQKCQIWQISISGYQVCFSSSKYSQNSFSAGARISAPSARRLPIPPTQISGYAYGNDARILCKQSACCMTSWWRSQCVVEVTVTDQLEPGQFWLVTRMIKKEQINYRIVNIMDSTEHSKLAGNRLAEFRVQGASLDGGCGSWTSC